MKDLEAVCFDLDDTLVQTTYFNEQSLNAVAKVLQDRRVQLGISESDARRLVLKVTIQHGASYNKLFEELAGVLGVTDEKILTELIIAYGKAEDASIRPFPGVSNLLRLLIRSNMKMGVVTNGDAYRQWKKLMALGIADLFDIVLISDVVQVRKPDPKIFQIALDGLDVDPPKSVFIGDRPDLDVKGAKQVGMSTIRVLQGREAGRRPTDPTEMADAEVRSIEEVAAYLLST